MTTDPVGDMLTQIRNGYLALKKEVVLPSSKMKEALAEILIDNGFLKGYEVSGKEKKVLCLALKYKGKKPGLVKVRRVSKPGRRIYVKAKKIKKVLSGLGIMVVSTPQGMMTGKMARKNNLGGEVICYLW